MQQRRIAAGIGLTLGMCLGLPTAWAADEAVAEASTISFSDVDRGQLLQSIEATRQSDPELAAEMEQQLQSLESGDLNLRDLGLEGTRAAGESFGGPQSGSRELTAGLPGVTPTSIPAFEGGAEPLIAPSGGRSGGESLPPDARRELQELFQQGTGDPNSSKDRELREKAGEILEKHGIDPREMGTGREGQDGTPREGGTTSPREAFEQWERSEQGQRTDAATREQYREMSELSQTEFDRAGGLEQRGEGFERAMTEHMAPEAREQMERFTNERELTGHEASPEGRETMEREFGGASSERSFEAPTREYESSAREQEAPSREFEAPTREFEAPTHEYEAPSHEGSGMDSTPERAYEGSAPDTQPPQP
jgi:hypothetical protein